MTSPLFTSQETAFVNDKLILRSDTTHDVVGLPGLPRYTWKFCYSYEHQICEIGTRMALSWSTDIVCWTRETMDQTICDSGQCDGTIRGRQIRILLPEVWIPPRKTVSNKVNNDHLGLCGSGTHSIFHASKLTFNMYPNIPQNQLSNEKITRIRKCQMVRE